MSDDTNLYPSAGLFGEFKINHIVCTIPTYDILCNSIKNHHILVKQYNLTSLKVGDVNDKKKDCIYYPLHTFL